MADYALIVVGALLALGIAIVGGGLLLSCLCGKHLAKADADAAEGADTVEGTGVSGAGGAA